MNPSNHSSKEKKVYKVLTIKEWGEASEMGQIVTELDQQDGFVHLSSATQLNMTLSLYFSDEEKVVLVEINESDMQKGFPMSAQKNEVEILLIITVNLVPIKYHNLGI